MATFIFLTCHIQYNYGWCIHSLWLLSHLLCWGIILHKLNPVIV